MTSFVALNSQAHQTFGVDIKHPNVLAEGHNLVPVFMGEFVLCAAEFPLVFAKNNETGQIRPVAMLGLKPEENFFYSDDGWLGSYAPLSTRPSPLVVMPERENSENLVVCIDENSPHLNKNGGERLFDDSGNQTDYLKQASQFAAEARAHAQQTLEFVDKLLEFSLLQNNPISVEPVGEEGFNLTGLYIVDEAKLNALASEQFIELRSLGYLKAIYTSLASLHRLDYLLTRRMNKS